MHCHDSTFTHPHITPDAVLEVLRRCKGIKHGATAADMVMAITRNPHVRSTEMRHFRRAVEALRTQGHPICADPTHGYYLPSSAAELESGCRFLRNRAMTSLRLESVMRRISLGELIGQLRLSEGI